MGPCETPTGSRARWPFLLLPLTNAVLRRELGSEPAWCSVGAAAPATALLAQPGFGFSVGTQPCVECFPAICVCLGNSESSVLTSVAEPLEPVKQVVILRGGKKPCNLSERLLIKPKRLDQHDYYNRWLNPAAKQPLLCSPC